jgi:hypothetical protein
MSKIVEPQILEAKPSLFSEGIKNNTNLIFDYNLLDISRTPVLCKDGTTKNQLSSPNAKYADACINNGGRAENQNSIAEAQIKAQQQALMLKQRADTNNRLTDRVFGKETNFVSGGGSRLLILPAYVVLGIVVGRYVAKSMKKSTTLGMVVGGVLPLVAYQLSLEYDRKKLPKQESQQKVAIEPPTPMPNRQLYGQPPTSMPNRQLSDLNFNLDCPNGTKKIQLNCIAPPCPEMTVCA